MQCQHCSQIIADGAAQCPFCGQPQTPLTPAAAVPAAAAPEPAAAAVPAAAFAAAPPPGAAAAPAPSPFQNPAPAPAAPTAQPAAPAAQPAASVYDPSNAIRPVPPVLRAVVTEDTPSVGLRFADASTSANFEERAAIVSFKGFLGGMLLSMVPVIGFIYLLIASLSKKNNPNKRNWARATLLLSLIIGLISIVMVVGYLHEMKVF